MYLCIQMHASLTRERERERERERGRERERERKFLGGQFIGLEECCYLSPLSNNVISYKRVLTFGVIKLMVLSFKHWQAKCHNRRQQQFFDVKSMLF